MGKRFTESDLWGKEWFTDLTPAEKCAYFYIKDNCDCVGVWDVHKGLADFLIKNPIDWDNFISKCNGNIEVLPNGKWFLVDFCDFQYGVLTESCPPHRKYISVLKRHGLFERVTKGFGKGFNTLQEKEEEKETEQEVEKEEEKEEPSTTKKTKETKHKHGEYNHVLLTDKQKDERIEQFGQSLFDECVKVLDEYIETSGKSYKNHNLVLQKWPVEKARENLLNKSNNTNLPPKADRKKKWVQTDKFYKPCKCGGGWYDFELRIEGLAVPEDTRMRCTNERCIEKFTFDGDAKSLKSAVNQMIGG